MALQPSLKECQRDPGKMTQFKLITHFISSLWCQWNIALTLGAPPALCLTAGSHSTYSHFPALLQTRSRAHTPLSLLLSLSPLLSLLHFSARWVLECHYDFFYQKQTAGQDSGELARLSVLRADCAVGCHFDCSCFPFFLHLFTNWQIGPAHIAAAEDSSLFTEQVLFGGMHVNGDNFPSSLEFDPVCVKHWQTAE